MSKEQVPDPFKEYTVNFTAARYENAVANADKATGKEQTLRILERDIAGLQFQIALLREQMESQLKHMQALSESNRELSAEVTAWRSFAEYLPQRITNLEGAYGGLSIIAASGIPTKKLTEAYEMGLKRGEERALTKAPKTE